MYENNPYIYAQPPPGPPPEVPRNSKPNGVPIVHPSTAHAHQDLFYAAPPRHTTSPLPPSVPKYSRPHHAQSLPSEQNLYLSRPHQSPTPLVTDLPPPPSLKDEDLSATPKQESPSDEKDLTMALRLSQANPNSVKPQSTEEEELARALEVSMLSASSGNSFVSGKVHPYSAEAGSSSKKSPIDVGESFNNYTPRVSDQMSEDEALARQLAEEEEAEERRRRNSQSSGTHSAEDDEAFARRLAEEEEEEERRHRMLIAAGKQPQIHDDEEFARRLEAQGDDVVSPVSPAQLRKESEISLNAVGPTGGSDSLPSYPGRSSSPPSTTPRSISSDYFSRTSRPTSSGSMGSSIPGPSNPLPPAELFPIPPPYVDTPSEDSTSSDPNGANLLRNNSGASSHSYQSSQVIPSRSDSTKSRGSSIGSPLGRSPLLPEEEEVSSPGKSQIFMDQELLSGVSIGFQTPSITDGLPPMTGSIPNVVSLPYGKCPPLHLKAPSWKHLLRLLARLSSSRLEPSVETHAVTKDSVYRLRTVVQFVKSHPMSQMWHTVLWFTIDHPVPSALPGAYKYTSNDPSILPFSYTLSSLPALLQETGDTKLSKTYTIPTTEQTPWPVLPITFPNLAMYLQAVLQESRRYQDDSTTAIRKFARMVTACYPSTEAGQFPDTEEGKKGMTGLFKKLKPSRGNKKSNGGRGNEDTYELVTPFTPDEWG